MKYRIFFIISLFLLIEGCSFAPKFSKPKMELPKKFDSNAFIDAQYSNVRWWMQFKDKTLDGLVSQALQNNDDLKLALARIEEAKAYLGLQKANLFPNVSLSFSAQRQKINSQISPKGQAETANSYIFSSSAAYEIDLWGKLRNKKKASLASLLSQEAAKNTVKITLISNVISTYFKLISINKQLEIAEGVEKAYRASYKYRQKQYKFGQIDRLILLRSKSQYENARILVESLKNMKTITKSALFVMIGQSPKNIFSHNISIKDSLPKPIKIPKALPSSLLKNRPDIIYALNQIKAKNAVIGAAKADYFPSISLTGLLGFQSRELSNLIKHSAGYFGVSGASGMDILDFGRVGSNVDIAEAQKRKAVIQYKKTVRAAFKEVYDALNNLKCDYKKLKFKKNQVKTLKESLKVSKKLFTGGVVDYLNVLDAQMEYLNAQLELENYKAAILNDEVYLYKALGIGWQEK